MSRLTLGRMILVSLVLRGAYAVLFVSQYPPPASLPAGTWGRAGGDTASYIDPVESLLVWGYYTPTLRMPGYAVVYVPLRLVLEQVTALNATLVLQVVCSAISIVLLVGLAERAFPAVVGVRTWAFWLFATSSYTAVWDVYILTESFATSGLIAALWLLLAARERQSHACMAGAGALLAWVVFLRPALGGLLPLVLVWHLIASRHARRSWLAASVSLLIGPFLLADASWTARNWRQLGKFMPLAPRPLPNYSELDLALAEFVQSWGGSPVYWDPTAEIIWFEHAKSQGYSPPRPAIEAIEFPRDIYTSRFGLPDLVRLKAELQASKSTGVASEERAATEATLAATLRSYADSVRRERPLTYYVRAPARLARRFLLHSGTQILLARRFAESSPLEKLFRLGMSLLYVTVIALLPVACLCLSVARGWRPESALLGLVVSWVILVHPVLYRLDESRYFVPAYPHALCLAAAVLAHAAAAWRLRDT